ncbi:hypothetical protein GCK72_019880 [Caenorhabditis remanei]|uniref:Uncharacterized protein n=1 Tax=Caenorhabditis remanei TaxID=31234 RepID=A0A6A5GF07_CAERE|nr:hypothetical protein GCK72_019880 [Caenorhabditis remanei]KAF1753324.1 hypothetical protein GCK72_019880 [Caenorhabditis remanei]
MNSSDSSFISSPLICQVCGQDARGNHYGATTCRACAAFFRRVESSRYVKPCTKRNRCDFFKNGFFTCKYCRLQKCFSVGMSSENFQFDRDGYNKAKEVVKLGAKIPPTMDVFCGRSNFIVFCAPQTSLSSPKYSKNFIDLQFLLDQAWTVLRQGSESPLLAKNTLGKLAIGLRKIQDENPLLDPTTVEKYGKDETFAQWEYDILKLTRWLAYFDDFQMLPQSLQIKMIQGIWSVWRRLERLASIALCVRRKINEETIRKMKNDTLLCNWNQMKIDMSWCSKYSVDELKFFMEIHTEIRLDELTRAMIELEPTEVELSFMLGQLCFQYVGKRFQGEILHIGDKFQEMLANDLHDYYVNELKRPNYVTRLASMMKINNQIQRNIYKNREKTDLAILFDVFNLEFSHPDMFMDL